MNWIQAGIRKSIKGLFSRSVEISAATLEYRTEQIRETIFLSLGDFGRKQYPLVCQRLRYAEDVNSLWYLRSEVMAVLSAKQGEKAAKREMLRISKLFRGLLPAGLTKSRWS